MYKEVQFLIIVNENVSILWLCKQFFREIQQWTNSAVGYTDGTPIKTVASLWIYTDLREYLGYVTPNSVLG